MRFPVTRRFLVPLLTLTATTGIALPSALAYEARINCGGGNHTTTTGQTYAADRAWTAGSFGYTQVGFADDTWHPIGGTPDEPLYNTVRGMSAYRFDVPNGSYLVTLHINDFWSHGPRQNQFDVSIEGTEVISNLDCFARVGKSYAMTYRFPAQVTDGNLTISTHVDLRHSYLNGIAVVSRTPDTAAPAAPTNLVARSSYGRNSIVWAANPEDDLAGYRVYRRVEPAGAWGEISAGQIQVPWFHDRATLSGLQYAYRVLAEDVYGNQSAFSNIDTASSRPLSAASLPVYEIFMNTDDLDLLNTDEGVDGEEYFPGTFVADGQIFQNVGLRYRGNVVRKLSKKSWRVRFNDEEPFEGQTRLNVNAEFPDKSLIREILGYEAFDHTTVPRSRSTMVLVALNGEYLGVHNDCEDVNQVFLARWGLDPDGNLYKAQSNFVPLADSTEYITAYEKQTNDNTGHGDIIDLIETVAATDPTTFYATMAPIMDLDEVIEWYSVNILISNFDFTYKNYYVYHDLVEDRWSIIPWDVDYTFGKTAILSQNFATTAPLIMAQSNGLVNKMMSVPALKRKHLENLIRLADEALTPALEQRIADVHASIHDDAIIDWLKYGWTDSTAFLSAPAGLQGYVSGRRAYVNSIAPGQISDDGLVINEFMAHNLTTISDEFGEFEDWIEVYNGSPGPKDLTGMFLTDNPTATTKWSIPPLVLEPGGYAFFWADGDTLQGPMHTNFRLDGEGEWVGLFASVADANVPIDFKRFGPQQTDASLGRTPDGALRWSLFGNPTPGAAQTGAPNTPPVISATTRTPEWPGPSDTVQITSAVTDPDGIVVVELHLDDGIQPETLVMYDDGAHGDGAAGDGVYGVAVPPKPDGTTVIYYVRAVDGAAIAATDPPGAPASHYFYEVGYTTPGLFINEILADNATVLPDEAGQYDDWVEIVNPGSVPVNLGGMTLTDDLLVPGKWTFPDTVIAPGGFVVVWCDDDAGQGPLHATFKLGADGEEIGLFESPAFGGNQIDAIVFGPQLVDISYGRYPDASGTLQYFGFPTPGAPNQPGNAPPRISDTWISPNPPGHLMPVLLTTEIVDEAALASARVFYDPTDNGLPEWTPLTLYDDGNHGDGAAGDHIYGATIPGQPTGTVVSFYVEARDGQGVTATDPPAGAAAPYRYQAGYQPPTLRINEVMALNTSTISDGFGEFDDWIEIHNAGGSPVSLGGMHLSDNLGAPRSWVLPDTTINPGEFLLIWADNDPEQGPTHATFALDAAGEAAGLFDTIDHFFAVIDTFSFGVQFPDTSFGRYPDGAPSLIYMPDPTPGAGNVFVSAPEAAPLTAFALAPPGPNPFQGAATIRFTLDGTGPVTLRIFDVQGRLVRRLLGGIMPAGGYSLVWEGRDDARRPVREGVYFLRLESEGRTRTQKLIRVR